MRGPRAVRPGPRAVRPARLARAALVAPLLVIPRPTAAPAPARSTAHPAAPGAAHPAAGSAPGGSPGPRPSRRCVAGRYGSAGYTPHSRDVVVCPGDNRPGGGRVEEREDAPAACTQALLWYITRDRAHAGAPGLQRQLGPDDGGRGHDRRAFDEAVGRFRDRVRAYVHLAPTGSSIRTPDETAAYWFGQREYPDGIAQETCRDFRHVGYSLAATAHIAETAFHQGLDLWGEIHERLRAALEFHARYEMGAPVPPGPTSCSWRGRPSRTRTAPAGEPAGAAAPGVGYRGRARAPRR